MPATVRHTTAPRIGKPPGRSHPCRRKRCTTSLRDLAAKLVTSGMVAGAAVNFLRALMESSSAPRDGALARAAQRDPRLVDSAGQLGAEPTDGARSSLPRQSPAETHAVFKNGSARNTTSTPPPPRCAAAASSSLPGDPLWLLIVAGPGGAKTETVQALAGCRCLCHQHDRQRRRAAVRHAAQAAATRKPPAACCARSATAARW